jgi:hypothetical protein
MPGWIEPMADRDARPTGLLRLVLAPPILAPKLLLGNEKEDIIFSLCLLLFNSGKITFIADV